MLKKVPKTIVPREAGLIASRYDNIAQELRQIADEMTRLMNEMEGGWKGNAKNRFYAEYGSDPSTLRATADFCNQCSRKIRSMTVTIYEWKIGN